MTTNDDLAILNAAIEDAIEDRIDTYGCGMCEGEDLCLDHQADAAMAEAYRAAWERVKADLSASDDLDDLTARWALRVHASFSGE